MRKVYWLFVALTVSMFEWAGLHYGGVTWVFLSPGYFVLCILTGIVCGTIANEVVGRVWK